jgi:hypothetical protein
MGDTVVGGVSGVSSQRDKGFLSHSSDSPPPKPVSVLVLNPQLLHGSTMQGSMEAERTDRQPSPSLLTLPGRTTLGKPTPFISDAP